MFVLHLKSGLTALKEGLLEALRVIILRTCLWLRLVLFVSHCLSVWLALISYTLLPSTEWKVKAFLGFLFLPLHDLYSPSKCKVKWLVPPLTSQKLVFFVLHVFTLIIFLDIFVQNMPKNLKDQDFLLYMPHFLTQNICTEVLHCSLFL